MQAPIILAIDIGSSKICVLIAEINLGVPRIIGMARRSSLGVIKGVISNIEQASHSIKATVDEAKRMAGVEELPQATICISGAYASGENYSGIVNVSDGEVKFNDIERVIKDSVRKRESKLEAIHILPYRFQVDDYKIPSDDPMGLSANRLECYTHIVSAKKEGLENLKKVIHNCGIEIKNIILSSYASSIAVLTPEEKQWGVACIDIGGEISDIMVHSGLSMAHNDYLGVGSNHITLDLAKALGAQIPTAEQIKKDYGDLIISQEHKGKALGFPTRDSEQKSVDMEHICGIIQARVKETLETINALLESSQVRENLRGVVLTGGFVKLKNLQKYANDLKIFGNLPVRIGVPADIDGIGKSEIQSPEMATAIGLVLHSAGKFTNYESSGKGRIQMLKSYATKNVESILPNEDTEVGDVKDIQIQERTKTNGVGNPFKKVFSGFYDWLKGLF